MNKIISTIALLAITGNVLMAGGDIAPVKPVVSEEIVEDEWEFAASFNSWPPGIRASMPEGPNIDITLSDILENLNFTVMGTVEVKKGKWSLLSDMIYLNIGKSTLIPIEPAVAITNIKMEAWISSTMLAYRVFETDKWKLDLAAGGRYLNIKIPLEFSYVEKKDPSFHVWDAIVGLKGYYTIDKKWFVPFHFDIGAGDTELTWEVFTGVGYKYENFDLIAGYRHLDWDFGRSDTGGKILDQLTVSGPIFGFKYYF